MAHLTSEQEAELSEALRVLTGNLRDLLETSKEGAAPVDLEVPIGRLSRMDAMQQQSMVQASRGAALRRMQQVEAAQRRLSLGEYGECLGCGEDVGYERLRARPEAPLCVSCQSRREESRS